MEIITFDTFMRLEVFLPCVAAYCLLCLGLISAWFSATSWWNRQLKLRRAAKSSKCLTGSGSIVNERSPPAAAA